MKKISRHIAESIISTSEVVSTDIEQTLENMQIIMQLDDDRTFMMKYNLTDHNKSYYFTDSKLQAI